MVVLEASAAGAEPCQAQSGTTVQVLDGLFEVGVPVEVLIEAGVPVGLGFVLEVSQKEAEAGRVAVAGFGLWAPWLEGMGL